MNKKTSQYGRQTNNSTSNTKQRNALRALLQVLVDHSRKKAGLTVRQLQKAASHRSHVGSSTVVKLIRTLCDKGFIEGIAQSSIRICRDVISDVDRMFHYVCAAIFSPPQVRASHS